METTKRTPEETLAKISEMSRLLNEIKADCPDNTNEQIFSLVAGYAIYLNKNIK